MDLANMPLIIPPVEDSESREEDSQASPGCMMSEGLQEHFKEIKRLSREVGRTKGAQGEELRRKERKKATEVALAMEEEITRWQAGIAELESLLAKEEQDPGNGEHVNLPAVIRFPNLSAVVRPDEIKEEEQTSQSQE